MKTLITAIIFCLVANCLFAQTLFVPGGTLGTSTATGKVGIGTSSPQIDLEVTGSGTGGFGQIIRNSSANGYTTLRLFNNQNNILRSLELDYSGSSYLGPIINGGPTGESASVTTTGAFPLTLGTANTARMTIASNGNIGIGTSNPQTRLEVKGILTVTTGNNNYLRVGAYDVASDNFAYISSGGQTQGTGLKLETPNAGSIGGITRMTILNNGNVGIGTSQPNHKLTVLGTIYSKEVKVDLSVPGPDYVFEEDYDLPSLSEVASYIRQNKHLPEVPSATEMEKNGIDVGAMNMLLLKKVEELTLYVIEQQQEINTLKKELKDLKK